MFFERKIYINNKPLILTNSAEHHVMQHARAAGYLFLKGAFPRNFRIAQKHLNKVTSLGVLIEDISTTALETGLRHAFQQVEAAGGVVSNPAGGVLMIYRRGKWDLPKGKKDDDEPIEDCAVREVKEETGLPDGVHLGEKICKTFHVYAHGAEDVLKTTHWYHMKVDQPYPLFPQKEENILEAKWIEERELERYLHHSYQAVREVLEESGKKWAK